MTFSTIFDRPRIPHEIKIVHTSAALEKGTPSTWVIISPTFISESSVEDSGTCNTNTRKTKASYLQQKTWNQKTNQLDTYRDRVSVLLWQKVHIHSIELETLTQGEVQKMEDPYLHHNYTTPRRDPTLYHLFKYAKICFIKSFNLQSMQRSYHLPASTYGSFYSSMLQRAWGIILKKKHVGLHFPWYQNELGLHLMSTVISKVNVQR